MRFSVNRILVATFSLGACVPSSYTAGALTDPPPGTDIAYANARRVSECLDLAAWTIEESPRSEVALQVDTGNRCDRAVDVDLARLNVTAACAGRAVALAPIDPDDPPPLRRLAPYRSSSANVVFEAPRCAGRQRVCVDVSYVAGGASRQPPICFPSPSPG
jgi:hypothetical protein